MILGGRDIQFKSSQTIMMKPKFSGGPATLEAIVVDRSKIPASYKVSDQRTINFLDEQAYLAVNRGQLAHASMMTRNSIICRIYKIYSKHYE